MFAKLGMGLFKVHSTKISIIIPVYNAEKWLAMTIDSVLSQSYNNYELILIDDGSTDESSNICLEYVKIYPNIKYLSKSNGGVSSARNAGLDLAEGDLIAFLDSDDWLAPEFLETLVSNIGSADLICSGINWYGKEGINVDVLNNSKFQIDKEEDLVKLLQQPLITSPCAKLYRRNIINETGLRFITGIDLGEDRIFNLQYLAYCKSVRAIQYSGYNYRRGISDSLTQREHKDSYSWEIVYIDALLKLFSDKGFQDDISNHFLANRIFFAITDSMSKKMSGKKILEKFYIFSQMERRTKAYRLFLKSNLNLIVAPCLLKNAVVRNLTLLAPILFR